MKFLSRYKRTIATVVLCVIFFVIAKMISPDLQFDVIKDIIPATIKYIRDTQDYSSIGTALYSVLPYIVAVIAVFIIAAVGYCDYKRS